jgi:hypothetical protein
MPPKPHRVLIDRVSGYAAEAAAFMRRRRATRQPFARIIDADGRGLDHRPGTPEGDELQLLAGRLIDAIGPSRRRERA